MRVSHYIDRKGLRLTQVRFDRIIHGGSRITLLMTHRETHRQRGSSDSAISLFDVFRVARSEVRGASTSRLRSSES